MVAVESEIDVVAGCFVRQVLKGPIGIVFRSCGENDYLVVLGHLLEELDGERPHQDCVLVFVVMH